MSQNIMEIKDMDGKLFVVTSFCGMSKVGKSVQLTIRGNDYEYVCLSEKDTRKLIKVLQKRLRSGVHVTK